MQYYQQFYKDPRNRGKDPKKYNSNLSDLYNVNRQFRTTVLKSSKYFNPYDKVLKNTSTHYETRRAAVARLNKVERNAKKPYSRPMMALRNFQQRFRKERLHRRRQAALQKQADIKAQRREAMRANKLNQRFHYERSLAWAKARGLNYT